MAESLIAAKKVGEDILSLMNTYSSKEEIKEVAHALTEYGHRTLQQCAMGLIVEVIRAHAAKGQFEYDARNEATVKLCKAIVERCPDELHLPFI